MPYSKKRIMPTTAIGLLMVSLMLLSACGGGNTLLGTNSLFPSTAPVTIELTPVTSTQDAYVTTVTATVYDQTNQGVTWTIAPVNFGTLSAQTSMNQPTDYQTIASVTYTAPSNAPVNTTVTITATSISNPNISASTTISVPAITVLLTTLSSYYVEYFPAPSQTLGPAQQLSIRALVTPEIGTNGNVKWTLSPSTGAGSLTDETSTSVTYVAPTTVSSTFNATLTATSLANPGATGSMQITVLPSGAAPNVAVVNVDGGPIPNQAYPNAAFTSVTICNPNSVVTVNATLPTPCQTVDGILVDTGSYGLRILQSEIPLLKLPTLANGIGSTLQSCVSNVDGSYLWGPVSLADLYISGETSAFASRPTLGFPIQVISSSDSVVVPDSCSNGGTSNLNTPQLLGANGILGIGPEPTDCTVGGVNYCDGSAQDTAPNLYYACPAIGCLSTDSPVVVPASLQITNPVTLLQTYGGFGNDSNGAILQFPAVSTAASAIAGTLTFGIGTETNNQLGNATIFTLDSNDNFTTTFDGQTLTGGFFDSGSNALFFPSSMPTCQASTQFFCPSSPVILSAKNQGATQGQNTVSFTVNNADDLFSAYPGYAAFANLAGPIGTYQSCSNGNSSCVFDWGLPFFYGRTVFTHIDSCAPPPTVCDPLTAGYFAY
jgi:hypothetical protein